MVRAVFACLVAAGLVLGWLIRHDPGAGRSTDPAATTAGSPVTPPARRVPPRWQRTPGQPRGFEEHLAAVRGRLGPSPSPEDVMALIEEIAGTDRGLAIELAHALGQTAAEKTTWVTDLATRWASSQPQQAWDWLSRQDASHLQDLALGTLPEVIIGTMAQSDSAGLVRNLDGLIRAGESGAGVPPVVATHLAVDALVANNQPGVARTTVETWARDPARPAIGESAYVSAAMALGDANAGDAGAWLQSLPASEERDIALVEFPAHWAQTQPREAMDWTEKNLTPPLRTSAQRRTFSDWVERSPDEAREWLKAYLARVRPSAETDALVGAILTYDPAARDNPATGLAWTTLITDPYTRRRFEATVASR